MDREELEQQIRKAFASSGGKARAKALTKAQRSESARAAINARWKAVRKRARDERRRANVPKRPVA